MAAVVMLDSLCHKFSSNNIHYLGRQEELANVVLPDPLGPIRATRDRLGMEIFIGWARTRAKLPVTGQTSTLPGSQERQLRKRYFIGKNRTLLATTPCVQQWATSSRSATSLPTLTC